MKKQYVLHGNLLEVDSEQQPLAQSTSVEFLWLDPIVRRLATLAGVEAATPGALSSGSMFFSGIERNPVEPSALKDSI